ncbi:MAG: hypothetical protein D3914_05020 [Candidatus Electrothrix sp. LOE2]|jgi:hypothetical protein|nr:hypothetical protein [Candidatus Electrothrix sp. LOE2]
MTAHQKSKRINIIGHKNKKMSRKAFPFCRKSANRPCRLLSAEYFSLRNTLKNRQLDENPEAIKQLALEFFFFFVYLTLLFHVKLHTF